MFAAILHIPRELIFLVIAPEAALRVVKVVRAWDDRQHRQWKREQEKRESR
jgi:hypothetical protein